MSELFVWHCAFCSKEGVDDGTSLALGTHYDLAHNPRGRHSQAPETWDARALELIRAAALTGRVFTIAEVLAPLGDYPDPGQRQFVNGQLTRRAIAADLLRDAGSQESVKPGTKRSLVHQWVGNPALRGVAA